MDHKAQKGTTTKAAIFVCVFFIARAVVKRERKCQVYSVYREKGGRGALLSSTERFRVEETFTALCAVDESNKKVRKDRFIAVCLPTTCWSIFRLAKITEYLKCRARSKINNMRHGENLTQEICLCRL